MPVAKETFHKNQPRGFHKILSALDHFDVDVSGLICADLGANVGGFTRALLSRNAKKVYAVDTGYGVLEYDLRRDDRVVVMERTNALRVSLPELCDLAVIDLGWTRQKLILPKARELIHPQGQIITLIKPQYEAPREWLKGGTLTGDQAAEVLVEIVAAIPQWKLEVIDTMESPIHGKGGNIEYLALLKRA